MASTGLWRDQSRVLSLFFCSLWSTVDSHTGQTLLLVPIYGRTLRRALLQGSASYSCWETRRFPAWIPTGLICHTWRSGCCSCFSWPCFSLSSLPFFSSARLKTSCFLLNVFLTVSGDGFDIDSDEDNDEMGHEMIKGRTTS